MKKRVLIISTTPLIMDGLTEIEIGIIKYNEDIISFELACGYGFDTEIGQDIIDKGVICHQLPPKKKIYSYMKEIRQLVKRGVYDSVYIHGNSAIMILEALPSKMAHGSRIITHCHNTNSNYPLIHHIVKPLFNKCVDIKIACSESAAKWAYQGRRILVIRNGIDLNRFAYNEEARNEKRKKLEWESQFIIGHVGRFSAQKNHIKIISIFEEIIKIRSDARLLLVGDGELKEKIIALTKSKNLYQLVRFEKTTTNIEKYYQAMDVFLMPSLFEGLGLAAVEAQANGLPTYISDQFPTEARATSSVQVIPLEKTAKEWAKEICASNNIRRQNNISQMRGNGWEKECMMKSIREILMMR